ncbi:MAG: SH3 domain-containing protein [Romboutsia sp.]
MNLKKGIAILSCGLIIASNGISTFANTNNEADIPKDNIIQEVDSKTPGSTFPWTVTASNVNFRRTPSSSGTIVRVLQKGEMVYTKESRPKNENGYYHVRYKTGGTYIDGYVSAQYITESFTPYQGN